MGKSKAQLRAEAVERLRKIDVKELVSYYDAVYALITDDIYPVDKAIDALIDLLTDESGIEWLTCSNCGESLQKSANIEIRKTESFVEHDIYADGVHIGTVETCPERMEISRLSLFEPYQNKGYGTEVVRQLVELGYKSLWVRSDNHHAIHVYEKCGFVKGNETMYEMMVVDE